VTFIYIKESLSVVLWSVAAKKLSASGLSAVLISEELLAERTLPSGTAQESPDFSLPTIGMSSKENR